jgi:hypothetical protein
MNQYQSVSYLNIHIRNMIEIKFSIFKYFFFNYFDTSINCCIGFTIIQVHEAVYVMVPRHYIILVVYKWKLFTNLWITIWTEKVFENADLLHYHTFIYIWENILNIYSNYEPLKKIYSVNFPKGSWSPNIKINRF